MKNSFKLKSCDIDDVDLFLLSSLAMLSNSCCSKSSFNSKWGSKKTVAAVDVFSVKSSSSAACGFKPLSKGTATVFSEASQAQKMRLLFREIR